MAEWAGRRLRSPRAFNESLQTPKPPDTKWPRAACGSEKGVFSVEVSTWPVREPYESLASFLHYPLKPLSERAAAGFLERTTRSTLRFPDGLLDAVERHRLSMALRAAA
jgi:DNA (cytosine-5)-methyltransferase 1